MVLLIRKAHGLESQTAWMAKPEVHRRGIQMMQNSHHALGSSELFLNWRKAKRECPRHHGLTHRTSRLNDSEAFSETCDKDTWKYPLNDLSFAYSPLGVQQESVPSEELSRARRKSVVQVRFPSALQRQLSAVLPLVSPARRKVVLIYITVIPPGFL